MRRISKIEQLETRRLLSGSAVEVWGGNSMGSGDWFNVDKMAGFYKIAGSDAADATTLFSDGNPFPYSYFVIATRARVQIDAIQASDSSGYASSIVNSGGTDNPDGALSPGNGVATVGTGVSWGNDYAGFIVVANPGNAWGGIRVTTGAIDPMVQFQAEFDANYLQGATQPYAYRGSARIDDAGFITGVQIHAPSGQWLNVTQESNGSLTSFKSEDNGSYDSLWQMMTRLGAGAYTAIITSPVGQKVSVFNVGLPAWPTQVPSTTSLTHGQKNAPTTLTVDLATLTDPNVNSTGLWIGDVSDNQVFSQGSNNQTSFGPITLAASSAFSAEAQFQNQQGMTNADGYNCSVRAVNNLNIDFSTSNFGAAAPDLVASFPTMSVATVNPGDMLTFNVSVANTGGLAIGKSGAANVGIRHEMHLSTDQVYGNADDLPLFSSNDEAVLPNWNYTGQLTARVPDNAAAGSYYIVGTLDANNAVAESNEANNTGSSATQLVVVRPQSVLIDPTTKALTIWGSPGADNIDVSIDGATLLVNTNGSIRQLLAGSFNSITVISGDSNDHISVGDGFATLKLFNPLLTGVALSGGTGDDSILSGDGNDSLYGGDGNDVMAGGAGDDLMYGEGANDAIHGGKGNDTLYGSNGNDVVYGDKGNDVLYGQKGSNYLDGGPGFDTLYARNSLRDSVVGGAGIDHAQIDSGVDVIPFSDVETLMA